jgi:hypothetical protein
MLLVLAPSAEEWKLELKDWVVPVQLGSTSQLHLELAMPWRIPLYQLCPPAVEKPPI